MVSRAVNPSFVMLWAQSQSYTTLEKQTSQNKCLCLRHISFHQISLESISPDFQKFRGTCNRKPVQRSSITIWNLLLIFSALSHVCHHTVFCILKKYPVNRLSNRSLNKKVLFIKPLSWTSVFSWVTKCSAMYWLFKYCRDKCQMS